MLDHNCFFLQFWDDTFLFVVLEQLNQYRANAQNISVIQADVCPSKCHRFLSDVGGCDAIPMTIWRNRDLSVIKVVLPGEQGTVGQLVVASAYFPYDPQKPPPPVGVVEHLACCREKRLSLLLRYGTNSHHIVWESSNVSATERVFL